MSDELEFTPQSLSCLSPPPPSSLYAVGDLQNIVSFPIEPNMELAQEWEKLKEDIQQELRELWSWFWPRHQRWDNRFMTTA